MKGSENIIGPDSVKKSRDDQSQHNSEKWSVS